ncbi:EAL domain-containing protein [Kineococcus sp. T13]|uniref:putative bifunctional diguanylate cyclase/phosphodiesterase n=1 Tax=Kineococcus vitellinus TaxID=2696565 RepID=UPI001412751B|nr:bifunctional diguanylate cyclase/phosphodiesterase [Kineococcus vitellinus]NAZ75870.1 EAL domain-containing protein [Kineococcus vitellinus]
MGLTAGTFFVAGGAAALAVILAAHFPDGHDRLVLLALAGTAVLTGAGLLVAGRRLPRLAYHAVLLLGTLLITLAVPLCPTTVTALAISTVYVLVAVDVMFFFPWQHGSAHLAVLFAAASWALCDREGVTTGVGVAMGVVCLVVATVTALLVRIASDASHDGLTGLLNRRGFDVALDAAVAAGRTAPLSAALLDVDHFKTVNDGGGHGAGDALLQRIADQCAAALPADAVLARYGGDEFALLLPGHDGRAALAAVERLRTRAHGAGLSAGVAQLCAGESGADLVRRADTALYAAKAGGRGRSRLDDLDSVELARDLARAVADGQVRAWFQPVVSPASGGLVGVEALARWTHPVRGAVPPLEFVPVAESTGLIAQLGRAVMVDACRSARVLRDARGRDLLLTVNVSGRELTARGYADSVLEVCRATGWPADLLVVEVTESLLDGSSGAALQALEELRGHGVGVAIDDFGTGYSSFSRLDTLPADYLKLDSGFIAEITTSPRRAGMLAALLSLARSLGLQVVAEGVETDEQAELLVGLGCPLAQGWLFGRPVPPADLAELAGAREAAPPALLPPHELSSPAR